MNPIYSAFILIFVLISRAVEWWFAQFSNPIVEVVNIVILGVCFYAMAKLWMDRKVNH